MCRKTAGGSGSVINIMAVAATMTVRDPDHAIAVYRATFVGHDGSAVPSSAERHFCSRCASALWLWDPRWPDLIHPFAAVIDTDLPVPIASTHIMLGSKAPWAVPEGGPHDETFEAYPASSIEDWHRPRGVWID